MTHKAIKQGYRNKEIEARWGIRLYRLIYVAPMYLALALGCKKTEPTAPAAPQVAVPVTPAPVTPVVPVPTFSAAQKIGMFVYPKNNQSHDQQLIDESACYDTVGQQRVSTLFLFTRLKWTSIYRH